MRRPDPDSAAVQGHGAGLPARPRFPPRRARPPWRLWRCRPETRCQWHAAQKKKRDALRTPRFRIKAVGSKLSDKSRRIKPCLRTAGLGLASRTAAAAAGRATGVARCGSSRGGGRRSTTRITGIAGVALVARVGLVAAGVGLIARVGATSVAAAGEAEGADDERQHQKGTYPGHRNLLCESSWSRHLLGTLMWWTALPNRGDAASSAVPPAELPKMVSPGLPRC